MDPHEQFCHNKGCRAYGRKGEGHVVIHSSTEQRYQCKRCKKTFSATKGTAFYRIHKPHELVLMVLTLCSLTALPGASDRGCFRPRRAYRGSLAKRGRGAVQKGA